jgi:hypothetical protein
VNHRFRFDQAEKRVRIGDDWIDVPQFLLEVEGSQVTLSVYSKDDEVRVPRGRSDGDLPQRARLAEVEALLSP